MILFGLEIKHWSHLFYEQAQTLFWKSTRKEHTNIKKGSNFQ
jgi:hypothetical protein